MEQQKLTANELRILKRQLKRRIRKLRRELLDLCNELRIVSKEQKIVTQEELKKARSKDRVQFKKMTKADWMKFIKEIQDAG